MGRRKFILGMLIGLAALVLCAAPALAGPKASFKSTNHNFGDVPPGKSVSHVFVLTNTGDETLKIDKVEAP